MSVFYPAYSLISSISQAQNAVVTFPSPHDFTVGEIVSFRVSPPFGMFEMNNQETVVQAITPTTITTTINSMNYTPFVQAPYQLPILNILVNTPVLGETQFVFASNPFTVGEDVYFQDIDGTNVNFLNGFVYQVINATPTTINISFNSNLVTYVGGGLATLYPFSDFTFLPMAIPSSSGVIPNAVPPQTNLADAFDNIPNT
ncbi:MAG TPA: hypothetical protein VIJ14_07985 [Rhabdochlamydiaceae bacterium]